MSYLINLIRKVFKNTLLLISDREKRFRNLFNKILDSIKISYIILIFKKLYEEINPPYIRFNVNTTYLDSNKFQSTLFKTDKKEPKIIGIFLTWNNLEFFKSSLEQALEFCDEVLLVEGCHYEKYPKRSTDGTVNYLQRMKSHPKLRIFDFNFTDRNDIVQLKIRTSILKYSKFCTPGNWIIQWDDDNFFFEEDLKKIKEIIKYTKYDTLVFKERRFIFNFRFNTFTNQRGTLNRGGGQIDRITEGAFFKGVLKKHTHPRLFYKNGVKYNNIYYSDIVCFHYHQVKTPDRMKARWEISTEKGYFNALERYNKFMAIVWKDDKDILQSSKKIEELNGESGFNVYYGPHPQVLSLNPWRFIDDVRKAI
jgi:hypothetical protein